MRIYIAGRYGARRGLSPQELQSNVNKAIEVGRAIIRKGHNVFIPHLYHYVDLYDVGKLLSEDTWLELCLEWVVQCDAIFMMEGWEDSRGCRAEHSIALLHKRTRYYDLDDIP